MQRSELDEYYSLSSKISCKEMLERMPGVVDMAEKMHLDFAKFIDPFTKKVNNNYVIVRTECPLCDSKSFQYLFQKHGFDHMLCNSCDLIFTLQILDNSKIKHLEEGSEGETYGDYKENNTVNDLDRKKFEIVFEQLEAHADIHDIFDFGSQSGTFLDWAQEKYSIVGHEYHTPIRNIAIKKGHTVLNDNLEDVVLDKQYDLITCWDYIDHVINPRKVVDNLTKYLKKGGLFFFAINNRDSLSVRMMHEFSPVFIGPHHTMHYGVKQLKKLMQGYEMVHAESYVSELNWLSNWLNFKNPEFGDSELMFDLLDPKSICELGMGIKANVIFKKL